MHLSPKSDGVVLSSSRSAHGFSSRRHLLLWASSKLKTLLTLRCFCHWQRDTLRGVNVQETNEWLDLRSIALGMYDASLSWSKAIKHGVLADVKNLSCRLMAKALDGARYRQAACIRCLKELTLSRLAGLPDEDGTTHRLTLSECYSVGSCI